MSQEIDGNIAGIAELFCPDYYTRIKIRDVNPSPPKVVRSSIIITTNLPFSEWPSLFENTAMVVAMIDRLTFKSSRGSLSS